MMPDPDDRETTIPGTRRPRAPDHLTAASRALWRVVVRDYALQPHHLEILRLACEALDRAEQARQTIAADGLMIETRNGPRLSPLAAVERDSAIRAARMLRELGLDLGDDRLPTPWRPA